MSYMQREEFFAWMSRQFVLAKPQFGDNGDVKPGIVCCGHLADERLAPDQVRDLCAFLHRLLRVPVRNSSNDCGSHPGDPPGCSTPSTSSTIAEKGN